MERSIRKPPLIAVMSVVVALVGLYLAIGGAWPAALGGSLYYVVAGIGLLATAILLFLAHREALFVTRSC